MSESKDLTAAEILALERGERTIRDSLKVELKPCPFCGSEAIIKTNTGNIKTAYWFWVECKNDECDHLDMCPRKTQEQAESDWNTRPIEDAMQARIAELEAELNEYKTELDRVLEAHKKATIRLNEWNPELAQDFVTLLVMDLQKKEEQ